MTLDVTEKYIAEGPVWFLLEPDALYPLPLFAIVFAADLLTRSRVAVP